MITFGPAGIPLSCKGRTVRDGILYARNLELDAMEVQFVRGIRMTEEEAKKIRETAEQAEMELHVKAPYYINLAGDEKNVEMSFNKILAAGKLGHEMGAESVVFHPGFYGELTKEETMQRIVKNVRELRNVFIREGWKPRLGMEIMGKRNVFGSLEEVLEVCQKVKGVIPVLDFAHIHARGNGILQNPEDFQAVFDKLAPLKLEHHLIHFTGIHYENGNARYRLPIKKGDLKFEPLCDVLLDNSMSATIISTSPILEHDAMYMNIVFDRVKERRDARIAREIRETQEADDKKKREDERKVQVEAERRRKEEEAARQKAEREAEKARLAEEKRLAEEEERRRKEAIPFCEALTKSRTQCQKRVDGKGKYCVQHKGWRGKTIWDLAENKTPRVKQSTPKERRQVEVSAYAEGDEKGEPYFLFKTKDDEYRFLREKKEGWSAVFKVPDGKRVRYSKQGLPTLKAAGEKGGE
ncbi:MAG TPA: TIM barrel protein [Candidatus Thermoplasmatota archaeon]|nr:TIM barrel protein [Candidatus Thermoplasmatota archaeon]